MEEKNEILENAKKYARKIFASNHDGHDILHTIRVCNNALYIAKKEDKGDEFLIALCSILHDVDDPKLFLTVRNQNARIFLENEGMQEEEIERVCTIINEISFSRNKGKVPSSIESMIVQDADRLDAIGAIGVVRVFEYGGNKGRPTEETLWHFNEKLLLLKDLMNTDTGRKEAERRHRWMVDFLREYKKEMECFLPASL